MGPSDGASGKVDEYISRFPDHVRGRLQALRDTIREAAPDAEETISYGMPAFRQNGILVYYAAFKGHVGFYPTASGIDAFKQELSGYKWSKGAVQFPYDRPIPVELVRRIVAFRVVEDGKHGAGTKRP